MLHDGLARLAVRCKAGVVLLLLAEHYFSPILTQLLTTFSRTSLYAQAIHVGESKGEAPTLQEETTGNLGALPDRIPLTGRPAVPWFDRLTT